MKQQIEAVFVASKQAYGSPRVYRTLVRQGVCLRQCSYRERLRAAGIEGSMNRSGNCWDNAPVESFFASLKCECVGDHLWERHEQARADGFRYIEGFYNRHRLHSSLGYLSPEEYEQAFELEQKDSLKLLST